MLDIDNRVTLIAEEGDIFVLGSFLGVILPKKMTKCHLPPWLRVSKYQNRKMKAKSTTNETLT